jgi:hypothetical protein
VAITTPTRFVIVAIRAVEYGEKINQGTSSTDLPNVPTLASLARSR